MPACLAVVNRVRAANLGHIVHIVEHDFTAPSIFKQITHLEGKVDMVTFSYSLSMIPDKMGALNNALKFLKVTPTTTSTQAEEAAAADCSLFAHPPMALAADYQSISPS